MRRSNLEWILITGFIIFHLLFLFVDSNSNIFLGISSLFFLLLTIQYITLAKALIYSLAFGLYVGSTIAVFMKLEHIQGAEVLTKAGMLGYLMIAAGLSFTAVQNSQRMNTQAFLPYSITLLVVAQIVLTNYPGMTEYALYAHYPIFLFAGQILLSRVSRGPELQGFYYALKLLVLSSGISVLDQTITSM